MELLKPKINNFLMEKKVVSPKKESKVISPRKDQNQFPSKNIASSSNEKNKKNQTLQDIKTLNSSKNELENAKESI